MFDNAAVRHATSSVAKLTFQQTAAAGAATLPKTGGPALPVTPVAIGAGIVVLVGLTLRLKLARR